MQRISRAPVLSATRRRVSAWITRWPPAGVRRGSSGALQHLGEPPALGLAERPGLDQADSVALVRLVALVVGAERGRPADDLLVLAVAACDVDPDGDRLVRLGRYDDALARLRPSGAVLLARQRLAGGRLGARRAVLLAPARAPAAPAARVAPPALLPLCGLVGDLRLVRHARAASAARRPRRSRACARWSTRAPGHALRDRAARCSRAARWRAGSAG